MADKKKITNDWHSLFPNLVIYEPMHLLNRSGPLLVGILLERDSGNDAYTPTFHVHNILNSLSFISLTLMTTIDNQYIYLEWHDRKYQELAKLMKERAPIPIEGDIYLEKVLEVYKKYVGDSFFAYQPQMYEDIVLLSTWFNNDLELQKSIDFVRTEMQKWTPLALSRIGGLESWLSKLEEKAAQREKLKILYEQRIIELKVDKLPERALLI
jgi:hypothetical protein